MTGFKTRNGFDKAVEKISSDIEEYEDILLIYIDIDQLRMINEEYGRAIGDELVVASARCIENVFQGKGTCYRIGGDEFAVLVMNPDKSEEFWLDQLKKETEISDRGSRYRISLSCGSSRLRDSDGTFKTVGDWKHEADRKLYENKKREDKKNGVH